MSDFDDDEGDVPTLNAEQTRWLSRLKRCLKEMPDGLELIVGHGGIDAFQEGWYREHIWDPGTDMLTRGGSLISEHSLYHICVDRDKVRPNSESE